MPSLDAARAKVARAKEHLDAVDALARAFVKSNFYSLGLKTDRKHVSRVRLARVDPIPKEFNLLLGDAAYNLRSALDHIAFSFCKPSTRKEERDSDQRFGLLMSPSNIRFRQPRFDLWRHHFKTPEQHSVVGCVS